MGFPGVGFGAGGVGRGMAMKGPPERFPFGNVLYLGSVHVSILVVIL